VAKIFWQFLKFLKNIFSQGKKSPKWRKFAQSGRRGEESPTTSDQKEALMKQGKSKESQSLQKNVIRKI
jgi:hypothetical protein